jgi:hypothetical protein
MRTWKAAFGLVALLTVSAHAGVIGPKRPSDLVNVAAFNGYSGMICSGMAVAFDYRVKVDGTNEPFTIPPGQVFVATGLEWDTYAGPKSGVTRAYVVMDTPSACDTAFAGSSAIADAAGAATGNVTFPTGIAIRPGVALGVTSLNSTIHRAKLYGYFTADK